MCTDVCKQSHRWLLFLQRHKCGTEKQWELCFSAVFCGQTTRAAVNSFLGARRELLKQAVLTASLQPCIDTDCCGIAVLLLREIQRLDAGTMHPRLRHCKVWAARRLTASRPHCDADSRHALERGPLRWCRAGAGPGPKDTAPGHSTALQGERHKKREGGLITKLKNCRPVLKQASGATVAVGICSRISCSSVSRN